MNPILNELYDIRREILAEHKDDLADFLRDELAQAKSAGHPVANVNQRRIRPNGEATVGGTSVNNLVSTPGDA